MSSLDEILAKVLVPDRESVRTDMAELQEAMKRPTICLDLLHIGKYSSSPQIRQYAIILLQKRLLKFDYWEKLTVDFKHGIKSGLLDALTQETDICVRNTTAQVIASVAKHELADRKWPELLEFVQQLCCQGESNAKELGLYVLSTVADSAGEDFETFFKPFVPIFHSALQDSNTSAFYACVALKKLIPCIGTDEAAMIEPLITLFLQTLFAFMTEADEEEEDDNDDEYYEVESRKPWVAVQTLYEMALHLPPDKVITPLLHWVDPVFKGSDIRAQHAGYTALAVVVEGCAEHIRTEYMAPLIQVICSGIKHPQAHVRNAALYAIKNFSEQLQPDIAKYANDILPILFEYLSATVNSLAISEKVPRVDRVFYALEMFCESMGAKLNPFVPALMEHILITLNPTYPFPVKKLALSAIAATANAVGKAMVPYFGRIMEHLKTYLSGELTEEEMPLQIQALDTLGVIARTIGEQTFRPFADECLNFTLNLVQSKDDPDLRKCAYGVFASLASVMQEDTAAALPVIIPLLMKAVESNEGVTVAAKDDDESAFPAGDLLDDDEDVSLMDNEDDDESDGAGYTVENVYLEEKKEACLALRELALQARGSFISYVEQCSGPVYKLVDCGPCCNVLHNYNNHEDIYSAALSALTQFTICIGKQSNGEQACLAALSILIPKLSEAVKTDWRFEVVSEALDCLTDLLKELKGVAIKSEGHLDTMLTCMKLVFYKLTPCQMMERAENDEGDLDSEACIELLEHAGDVLLAIGNAMRPEEFAPYFAELLTAILHSARENCKIAEKSFSSSVLAECMEPLDGVLEQFVLDLFTTFTNLMRDSDSKVRTNSVFGLGELVLHGRELLFPNFPQILEILSDALSRETNPLVLDNMCAAFTRMIIVNISAVPIDQVFPVLMSHLPLREDFQENSSVVKCFLFLLSNDHPVFASHLPQVMNVILTMATQQELQPEQKPMINELMAHIASGFPDLYNGWASALPAEVLQKWKEVLA